MAQSKLKAAGGFSALWYSLRKAKEAGGLIPLYRRLKSKNACKTCAFGMGGQKGGMVNEAGHFPEVCKKSIQAQAADMAPPIPESFFPKHSIQQLEKLSSAECDRLGRLTFPVMASEGDSHYHRISWDEAFDKIAQTFKQTPPDELFFYSSGRSSNEAGFLMQLMARAYGSSNIHNCSYYCHQASGVALSKAIGSGTASIVLEDLEKADLALIIGANPPSNHPRLMSQLMKLRRRGGKIITINPLKELGLVRFKVPSDPRSLLFGSDISNLYIQPKSGTDIALLKAILKEIVERHGTNNSFIKKYTQGWEHLLADLNSSSFEALTQRCGIEKKEIDNIVDLLLNAKNGILMWGMGLTHHEWGVDNILALSNIALALGWIGRPGSGLLPIRGHSNVQGIGSIGVTPLLKQAFSEKMAALFDIREAENPGLDTYASMKAAEAGRIQLAFLLGGNLYASNPDLTWASKALKNIPLTINISTKLNQGHFLGRGQTSIILPALARDEESQATTQESMFSYVRLSDGKNASSHKKMDRGEMRSEVDIIATLAGKILPDRGINWAGLSSHQNLRKLMADVVPGFQKLKAIDETKEEFQIENRTFHKPLFNTPTHKGYFYITPIPAPRFDEDNHIFSLMTLRSEGQFNTVVFEEEDICRGNKHRDVVMISPDDSKKYRLTEGERVLVKSEAGQMEVSISITDIAPSTLAMYYPESNRLVPQILDPQTKTPAFKAVAVTIEKII